MVNKIISVLILFVFINLCFFSGIGFIVACYMFITWQNPIDVLANIYEHMHFDSDTWPFMRGFELVILFVSIACSWMYDITVVKNDKKFDK